MKGSQCVCQEASASERNPVGTLRLGAIPTTLALVPLLTESCLQQFPRMRHEIHTLSATESLQRIRNFELDIGLSYLEDNRLGDFVTVPLFRERYVPGSAASCWPYFGRRGRVFNNQ